MTKEQIQELIKTGKILDINMLNEKKVKIFNYLNRKNIDIDFLRGKVGRCNGIFLTSLKEKHGSNLSTIPILDENLFYIFIDESGYLNNEEIVHFQLTHELLHGMFNQKNNCQIHFGHSYKTKEQLDDFLSISGINEACTQMIAEDIEGKRLNSSSDYLYDIKNIMRLMKTIVGEEFLIKQYIYNNKDFENKFNFENNNKFNDFAHYMNEIYKYDKKRFYNKLSAEDEQYISIVKNNMYDYLINLIKKYRPEIIKEIIDEIDDEEFLLKININQNNLGHKK